MANDQKPVISVRKLRKVYMMGQEHVVALHNIDLDIPRGEVCCIFGTSGSGKSTLLNQLAGLEKPTRGVVRIGGVPISQLNENQLAAFRQKHIGFVFQSYNLLPELTAAENVAMPLMFKGIDPDVRLLEAKKMLCRVGLKDRMDHFPNQMSGGQQQRVGTRVRHAPRGRVRRRADRQPRLEDDERGHAHDPRLCQALPPDDRARLPRSGDDRVCRPHRHAH